MIEFEKKIMENFHLSQKNYENQFKSYHWDYQISKKKIFLKSKILKISEKMIYQKDLMTSFIQPKKHLFF